jgi:DNA-binding LytR/AlgR family response regulator
MSAPLRILAVDDEPLALTRVRLLLERIPQVELVGTALSGPDALQLVEDLRPDVLLLDIRMTGQDGFQVIEKLSGPYVPQIIFVTAFDQFATKAFDVGAVDYVLKPVEFGRLAAALQRARRSLEAIDANDRMDELRQVVAALREQARATESKRYEREIWAEHRGEFVRIMVSDLDWISAERDYVRLHAQGQSYLLREAISNLEARLDPELFIRVRRSALARIDRVTGIRKAGYGDFRVLMNGGTEIRVGRTYVQKVRSLIGPRIRATETKDAS